MKTIQLELSANKTIYTLKFHIILKLYIVHIGTESAQKSEEYKTF